MTYRMLAVFVALAVSPVLSKAERVPILDRGMGYADVVRLWGPPLRKQQFETLRKDVWHFRNGRVSFVQGRVRDWALSNAEIQAAAAVLTNRAAEETVKRNMRDTGTNPAVVEEILEEIMREAPGGDDEEEKAAPRPR